MPAAPAAAARIINVSTTDNRTGRRLMAAINPMAGGGGGMPRDGTDGSGANPGFLKNTPDRDQRDRSPGADSPLRLDAGYRRAGRYRGGLGTDARVPASSPDTGHRAQPRPHALPPWGVRAARPAGRSLPPQPGTDRECDLGNTDVFTVHRAIVRIASPGAGGWGDPLDRDGARRRGHGARPRLRQQRARSTASSFGTGRRSRPDGLRQKMPRDGDGFGFNTARIAYERFWTRDTYGALTVLLPSLPVDWRFFVKHRIFEALSDAREKDRHAGRRRGDVPRRRPPLPAAVRGTCVIR